MAVEAIFQGLSEDKERIEMGVGAGGMYEVVIKMNEMKRAPSLKVTLSRWSLAMGS